MASLFSTATLVNVLAPLRRNVAAKLFALGFAFVLWFFVNAGKRETEVFQFPIEFRGLPEHTVLAGSDRTDTVAVKLNGPGPLLASLDIRRTPIIVDLMNVRLGEDVRLKIRDEMVRVPRGVRIIDVEPSRVPVRLEQVRRASVAVSLVRNGEPRDGFKVEGIKISPQKITITGPANVIDGLDSIETEPLDLGGLRASAQRTVNLVRPDQLLSLKPDRVTVDIEVAQVIITREFKRLAVEVRNVDLPFQLRPPRVTLTVRGPEGAVKGLRLDEPGSVYVDGAPLGPGDHVVQVEATLPPDVAVVKSDPPALRLEILEQKNGARR